MAGSHEVRGSIPLGSTKFSNVTPIIYNMVGVTSCRYTDWSVVRGRASTDVRHPAIGVGIRRASGKVCTSCSNWQIFRSSDARSHRRTQGLIDTMVQRTRLALAAATAAVVVAWCASPAFAVNPHGGFTSDTDYCLSCHTLHVAEGSPILGSTNSRSLCLSCHDGSASAYNVVEEYAAGLGSSHALGETLDCANCHTAHRGPAEGNPASFEVTGSVAVTGSEVCGACHGTGSALLGGNLAGAISGTPHDAAAPADSLASIGCRACHEPHASANASLVRTEVAVGAGVVEVSSARQVCLACHASATTAYSSAAVASAAKHYSVTDSTKALVSFPGGEQDASGCTGCHEPHGTGSGPSYTRLSGRALCEQCHDAAGLTYGANYSYQGGTAFSGSGHDGVSGSVRFINVGPSSEGFAVWESTTTPTPSVPGAPVTPERAASLAVTDGSRLVTSLQTTTDGHDYQLYRFKLPVETTDVANASVTWVGYGEETVGYPVAISLWRADTGVWEQVANRVMGTQQTVTVPVDPALHADAEGYVYLLGDSRFVRDGQLVSGPTFTALSGTSMQVTWVTAGTSSSWVDYGATTAYGQTAGSASRVTNHSVTITGLTTGVWNFRVRSVSPEGEDYTSENFVYALPAPSLAAPLPPDVTWTGTPLSSTLYWNALTGTSGPYEYRVEVNGVTTGWMPETSYVYSYNTPGNYSWRVEARDAFGVSHGWSPTDSFYVSDGTVSGSCPFLFVDDGQELAFEADLFTAGRIGGPTASGYQQANPNDAYVLANVPDASEGSLDFRLVEERLEVDYIDSFKLYTVDAPAGAKVYAQKAVAGTRSFPPLAQAVHTVRDPRAPRSVKRTDTGASVLSAVASDDGVYLELNEHRETGFEYKTIELDLGSAALAAPQVKIVMDAVSEFPVTAEGIARRFTFGLPTKLEVENPDGTWKAVPSSTGAVPVAPEFTRPYVFDLTKALVGSTGRVRFTYLFRTLIDSIEVDLTADEPLVINEVALTSADLREHGVDRETGSAGDAVFEYGVDLTQGRFFPGDYTRYGQVTELLTARDDKFVIMGQGDEIDLSFQAPAPAAPGLERSFVVSPFGYYKDLKTDMAQAVEPLPFSAMSNYPYPASESYPADAEHEAYRAEYNTRTEGEQSIQAEAEEPGILEVAAEWVHATANSVWAKVVWAVSGEGGIFAPEEYPVTHRSLNTDMVSLDIAATDAVSAGGECGACHSMHGSAEGGELLAGGRAASDGRMCTAAGTGCHSSAANSASGVDINAQFTANSDPRAHHDVMTSDQIATGSSIACADCHNPHKDNAAVRYADPDDISKTIASPLESVIDTSGALYVLVGADHDATGPVISGITMTVQPGDIPQVTWSTNEQATTWIDWGETTSYELASYGNDTLALNHTVQIPTPTAGVLYHYRVRSVDALGNVSTSADRTFKLVAAPPAPVMSDITTQTGPGNGNPATVPVTSSSVTAPDGNPVQYEFVVNGISSGWVATPSASFDLWDGSYSVQVRARDSVYTYAVSGWSAADTFTVTGAPEPVESCPNLFTWNGTEYEYVTDVMGLGPIGVRKGKDVYLKPEPVEDTVIPPGKLKARNGVLDIRLTDEREEIEYVDEVTLVAVDHPADTRLLVNDLHWGSFDGGREPTEYFTIADPRPVQTTYERRPVLGTQTVEPTDVSAKLAEEGDGQIAYSGLYDDNIWTFDLGELGAPERIKLVVSGWVDYANKTEKAAWIASGKRPPASYIEVQDASGAWVKVGDAPHPPGYPKAVVYDLTDAFPEGVTEYKVRMRIYMRMNLDYVAVDTTPDAAVVTEELTPTGAELSFKGVSHYAESPYPTYRYDEVVNPEPAMQDGAFTRYGDVRELLLEADDRFVIMDTGDDLAITFDEPSAPAEGMVRTYMIHTDGFHDTQSGSVEPLPFHAMSSYPYPDSEHYPDDELHTTYLAEWNTRTLANRESGGVVTEPAAVPWYTYHTSAWTTAPVPEDAFSVDTDLLAVRVDGFDDSATIYTPASGWESQSVITSMPTPASPGVAVGAGALGSASADDGVYWRTNLASADRTWNWQVAKFELGADARSAIRSFMLNWNGHGEPTAGYNTAVYVWNFSTSNWTLLRRADMAVDTNVITSQQAVSTEFCFRCHDGAPPAGVTFPAGSVNVGAQWNLITGDYHGAGTGGGVYSNSGLKQPYVRGQAPIPCSTCHATHGSSSIYHIPPSVNGTVLAPITTTQGLSAACSACHQGTADNWHSSCINCHYDPEGHDTPGLDFSPTGMNCVSCHKHSATWTHTTSPGCHCAPGDTYKTF